MDFSFKKKEHLYSRKQIAILINKGYSLFIFPFKIRWIIVSDQSAPVTCAFSVPKRIFKKAVHRNKIKRLMREAYRLNKSIISDYVIEKNVKMQILFTFIDTAIPEFKQVESKIILTLQSLIEKHEKGIDSNIDSIGKNL